MLILDYDSTEIVPGGAGNAASNVSALGGAATAVGAAGRDDTGPPPPRRHAPRRRRSFDRAASRVSHADQDAHSRRRRALGKAAGRAHRPRHASRRFPTPTGAPSNRGCSRRARAPTRCSFPTTAWVWRRRRSWREHARGLKPKKAGRPPTLIDSRYALLGFRGMTACTPNESEVEHLLGVRIGENARILEKAGTGAARANTQPGRPRHARQPRDGCLRAGSADDPHSHLRLRSDRRRHRRRRYRDRDDDAGARGRRDVPRGRAPGQLRRRARRHEARHRDGLRRRAPRRPFFRDT